MAFEPAYVMAVDAKDTEEVKQPVLIGQRGLDEVIETRALTSARPELHRLSCSSSKLIPILL